MTVPFAEDCIEIRGNRELFIDRCRRLLECSDVLMLAETHGLRVAVWGSGLLADDYGAAGLHIRGEITAIEFTREGGAG